MYFPSLQNIRTASKLVATLFKPTPLQVNKELSKKHNAKVYLKREDLTPVRSYKIRGAYNKMVSLNNIKSVVSCSAGNHAQGVAFSCEKLGIKGKIFMPANTTNQKINKVKQFGSHFVDVILHGSNFDESFKSANEYSLEHKIPFVHPFDDEKVIEGQGTIALEIIEQMKKEHIDYIFLPIGGGGLAAGVSTYIKKMSPKTKIIGVEPLGAPSMTEALKENKVVTLNKINTFVDGASVKKVGELNFPICQFMLDDVLLINEGHVCSKILEMYNENGFIIEPAGVLSLCALDSVNINGKTAVCIVSGGNSDVFRMPEILDRSLVYEGLKHYFKIEFSQKAGTLKEFVHNVLGPEDDIIHFRYSKIINKEVAPVTIGIQTKERGDINRIVENMNKFGIVYTKLECLDST
jgi:threonine dehydratase